jgi:hypothetical protein
MKALIVLVVPALLAACAGAAPAPQPAAAAAAATLYPAWLEMKPGYAEACEKGGGCVPMTQAELQELAGIIRQRTLEVCRRNSI